MNELDIEMAKYHLEQSDALLMVDDMVLAYWHINMLEEDELQDIYTCSE